MNTRTAVALGLGAAVKLMLLGAWLWQGHAHAADATPDVAALLQAADRYRTGQDNLQVETTVTTLSREGAWTRSAATPCSPRPSTGRWC